jgi:hypothetical protein
MTLENVIANRPSVLDKPMIHQRQITAQIIAAIAEAL